MIFQVVAVHLVRDLFIISELKHQKYRIKVLQYFTHPDSR